jgi:integrase
MQLAFQGRRLCFTLRTGNKEAAARRARDIYNDLVTLGVDATVEKHRPEEEEKPPEPATIGQWVEAASKVFDGRPATFGNYARCLRLIGGDILAVTKTKKRFAPGKANSSRARIDATPLSILTTEAVQGWRIRFVAKADKNPALQRTARISCNSLLRQARALFCKKMLKFISGLQHPDPVPFADCEMFPRESMRYNSKVDPAVLIQKAQEELSLTDPEAFKVLLLAIGAGLRRGEIDKLLWRQIDLNTGVIRIEATEAGALKSEDSAGNVEVDETFCSIFRGFLARASGPFMIEAAAREAGEKEWGQQYRCDAVFNRLNAWLRANGMDVAKPLHTLRKEAGSIIATQSGIHAASRFLRHADIQVTALHYADHKERVTVGIGALLKPENLTQIDSVRPEDQTEVLRRSGRK